MTPSGIRFLFDENFGKPLVLTIERLLLDFGHAEDQATVRHVLDFQQQGIWDEEWIPRLATEKWTVVAADLGRRGGLKKGRKLPGLCIEYGLTHFLLSSAVHTRKSFRKLLTILSVWHELISLARDAPPGSRFLIEPSGPSREAWARGKVTEREIRCELPPQPGFLFRK